MTATMERETYEPLVKADAIAELLAINVVTVRELARRQNDALPCMRIGGAIRFRASDVLAWADEQVK